jgi:hypothetical protein
VVLGTPTQAWLLALVAAAGLAGICCVVFEECDDELGGTAASAIDSVGAYHPR